MNQEFICVAIMACFVAGVHSTAMTAENMTEADAMNYLMMYGFAGPDVPDPALARLMDTDPDRAFEMGIMMFQMMYEDFGLNATGELDEATMELMAMDRCGFKDAMVMEDVPGMDGITDGATRKKRYAIVGNRWPQNDLTYRILSYTPDLSQSHVDDEIARAFAVWSDVTPLTFRKVTSGDADILITFAARAHGDGEPFDGRGGVLAHAYFPFNGNPIEGDAHFDEDERWTRATFSGTNLFQVAAHEFGHSLGLGHSNIEAALMAPFYRGYVPNFELHSDDIRGIQVLYGAPDTDMGGEDGMGGPDGDLTSEAPRTFPPNMPDFCRNSRLDALTAHVEENTLSNYAFQGDYYVRLDSTGIASGYPRKISDDWQGITGSVDAALYLEPWASQPAYTILFKGDRYHVFGADMTPVVDGQLSRFGLPNDIDAAFVWARNGRIYVMKGTQYYRLRRRNNMSRLLRVNRNYPRDLSVWNLPVDSIDSAHMWYGNMRTYFFKGQNYYRYNDASIQVDDADPPYPRDIGTWWFGCNNYVSKQDNTDDGSGSGSGAIAVSNIAVLSSILMLIMTIILRNCSNLLL